MLLEIGRQLPRPVRNFLKVALRRQVRRAFAMSYYRDSMRLIGTWSKLRTEDSNFYYKLTPRNRSHLAHLLSNLTGESRSSILTYFDELENDEVLRSHISDAVRDAKYGRDIDVNYARRVGWYAIARIIKPKVIIETGVDHGVGSCVLTSALARNASEGFRGRYYGTDINPKAGKLLRGKYAEYGEILYGDSIESLKKFSSPIDLFINDSDHSVEYEMSEYHVVAEKMTEHGVILSDNAHCSDSLDNFSVEAGRSFVFFSEKPENHWYPGGGIGISF
ncbi:methyltransferase [Pandoraea bronchicola]|uniref:Methyltransferase n=2 Tax=Pandoraea bronchicola TaxID=2508287 RepID=A0A5E5BZF0_9BURK|nr:methyltransferase [Pandoraea bronchicola]